MGLKRAKEILKFEMKAISDLVERLDKSFERAVKMIRGCKGRVVRYYSAEDLGHAFFDRDPELIPASRRGRAWRPGYGHRRRYYNSPVE